MNRLNIIHATWERENIGVDAYEITLDLEDEPLALAREEERLRLNGAEYVVVKTPVARPEWLFEMPRMGYAFVEMVFHVTIRRDEYHIPADIVRFDRGFEVIERDDEEHLQRIYGTIRGGIFTTDRVSLDPRFSLALSGNRYANWLHGLLQRGGHLYEVLQRGRPIGFFVVTRINERIVNPMLMGMYDPEGDRGLGTLLHKKTLDTCFEHPCDRLQSTIVSNNFKVLRVYLNAGATIYDTCYTYVKHFGEARA